MKKVNHLLRNENVQGNLFLVGLFALIITLTILTWGK